MKPQIVLRRDASEALATAARPFEASLGWQFDLFVVFSAELMRQLMASTTTGRLHRTIIKTDGTTAVTTMTKIAGIANPSPYERFNYLTAISWLLSALPNRVNVAGGPVPIAPARAGAALAKLFYGWTDKDAYFPILKRIPFEGGLAVGVSGHSLYGIHDKSVVLIEGAIASGCTIIALMSLLAKYGRDRWRIIAAHAALEGLVAIERYAYNEGIHVTINVGHVSGKLNDHFYAVDEAGRPVIGDVGDTILGSFLPPGDH